MGEKRECLAGGGKANMIRAVRENTLKPFYCICGKTNHLKHPKVQGAVVGMEHDKGDWTFTRITLSRKSALVLGLNESRSIKTAVRTMWELISGRNKANRSYVQDTCFGLCRWGQGN